MTSPDLAHIEAESIRAFVHQAADDGFLKGRVLDYGCGTAPYRRIIEEHGGTWIGYDDPKLPGSVVSKYVGDWSETDPVDAILCTQVVQYVPDVRGLLAHLAKFQATLVMTYPTHWPELRDDLWRFTKLGMEKLLAEAAFDIVRHEQRAEITFAAPRIATGPLLGDRLAIGYGVIATQPGWPEPAPLPSDYWETAQ